MKDVAYRSIEGDVLLLHCSGQMSGHMLLHFYLNLAALGHYIVNATARPCHS